MMHTLTSAVLQIDRSTASPVEFCQQDPIVTPLGNIHVASCVLNIFPATAIFTTEQTVALMIVSVIFSQTQSENIHQAKQQNNTQSPLDVCAQLYCREVEDRH